MQQTLKQEFEESAFSKEKSGSDLAEDWRYRLFIDCPEQSAETRDSIVRWLLGKDFNQFDMLNRYQLEFVQQTMEYRYRIFQQRYLGVAPEQAYRNLIIRLSSVVLLRNTIRTWVGVSQYRQRVLLDILQELIHELIQGDGYVQQQMIWISECTNDVKLRNALLLTSIETYCLRPIENQPLLLYQFLNYLRRFSDKGFT